MKISKVKHTKSAVGNQGKEVGGVLYNDPGKVILPLEKRLKSLEKSSQGLYNIFTPIQEGTEPKKPDISKFEGKEAIYNKRLENYTTKKNNYDRRKKYKEVVFEVNSIFGRKLFYKKEVGSNKKSSNIRLMFELGTIWKNIGSCEKLADSISAEEVVVLSLRSSLRSQKDGAICLLENLGEKNITQESKKKIKDFLDLVKKDFYKLSNKSTDIKRAITNQNIVVQPREDVIGLSETKVDGKRTSHKKEEKEGLAEFLSCYADLDEASRMNMLRKLRRLIDLYFAAPETKEQEKEIDIDMKQFVDCDEFNVWKKHEDGKNKKGIFVKIPDIFIKAADENTIIDAITRKDEEEKLYKAIRRRNIECYRFAIAATKENTEYFFENPNINKFWIHHIENTVERLLAKRLVKNLFKLDICYLSEKVWKDALNLISVKYISIGKAVFHFGLKDIFVNDKNIDLGKISKDIQEGINSFDYEYVKACENLQRELAINVAFAANNLARATVDISRALEQREKEKKEGKNVKTNMDDFLLWNKKDINDFKIYNENKEILKMILQFFGGISSWETGLFSEAYKDKKDYDYTIYFLDDLRRVIFALRNESFHFVTASINQGGWNKELVAKMFEIEAQKCVTREKDKFYANNLHRYYSVCDLERILNLLYSKSHQRASQVPSFNKVIVRKNFADFVTDTLEINSQVYAEWTTTEIDNWRSALYYLLKEVYYNCFLQDNYAFWTFIRAVGDLRWENNNEKRAIGDFQKRINQLGKKYSLSEICQIIMTEYNLQNNQKRTKKSCNDSIFDKEIFQHYKLLLMKSLASAFGIYIKEVKKNGGPIFEFLKTPKIKNSDLKADDFLPNWNSDIYKEQISEVKKDAQLQKWYIVARFLNARSLNLLIGSMRSYLQYTTDVERRAKMTGNSLHKVNNEMKADIEKAIPVIEICIKLSSKFTAKITDYFTDASADDDYAVYLSNYLNYEMPEQLSPSAALQTFCNDKKLPIGIYWDGQNPIPNRNIMMAKLYGPTRILEKIVQPVEEHELQEYFRMLEKIKEYRETGKCTSKDMQEDVLAYQKNKKRIELQEIVEYAEVINELLGQLLNWSFVRERDLLYFQLGFHYLCLKNETPKPELYKRITRGNNTSIDSAILYQIAGMYINGIGVFAPDDKNNNLKEQNINGGTGPKINSFIRYSKSFYAGKPDDYIYNAGLEVFENINEHDNITDFRNAIEHFKFYTGKAGSILDLYSEVFDRFFTYDMKYQKNVLNMLYNILLRHYVVITSSVGVGEKKIGRSKEKKKHAQIEITGITSDKFTYKYEKESLKADARNPQYLEMIAKILYYPDKTPEGLVRIREDNAADNSTKKNKE